MASEAYTLVTVTFREEYDLLRLQARSLNRYLDTELAQKILVIENTLSSRPKTWRRELRREYGALGKIVEFVHRRELAEIPSYVSGWFSQQILKLMSARIISTNRYIVLDTKNHLVFPLTRSFVEGPSGKMRLHWVNYEQDMMRPFLEESLSYFGLAPRDYLQTFLPTVTPFPFPTQIVCDLVRYIETREQKLFPDAFVQNGFKLTEFFLFGAYLMAFGRSITDIYEFSGVQCPTIRAETEAWECREMIARSEASALPVFSVHRRAIPKLDEATRLAVAKFWYRRQLFGDSVAPLRFLCGFNCQTNLLQQGKMRGSSFMGWRRRR